MLQISAEQCGHVKTVELKHGGANIPVTNENKKGIIASYILFWETTVIIFR